MTALFQKNNFLLLSLLLFASNSRSQTDINFCNREVKIKEYEKHLIKEVCIPNGYIIYFIKTKNKDIDIDGDGLYDFIFDWTKKQSKEGDTCYITAYKMNKDSTYGFLKTFKNLLPITLKSYDKASNNPYYADFFWDCYHHSYPLNSLEFRNGEIIFEIKTEAVAGLIFNYQYNKQKNNWLLISIQQYFDSPDKGRLYEPYPMSQKEETIDDFSYEKYLCPERVER
jgi:hypothetical protein